MYTKKLNTKGGEGKKHPGIKGKSDFKRMGGMF
jgi:hypothetical protein